MRALDGLIDFHLDFAFGESDLIRIQDRDLGHLPESAKRQVRKAQRQYVEIWVDVLRQLDNSLTETAARLMAHAAFGLLNSTPHSVKPGTVKPAEASSRAVLRAMTVAALTSSDQSRRYGVITQTFLPPIGRPTDPRIQKTAPMTSSTTPM